MTDLAVKFVCPLVGEASVTRTVGGFDSGCVSVTVLDGVTPNGLCVVVQKPGIPEQLRRVRKVGFAVSSSTARPAGYEDEHTNVIADSCPSDCLRTATDIWCVLAQVLCSSVSGRDG